MKNLTLNCSYQILRSVLSVFGIALLTAAFFFSSCQPEHLPAGPDVVPGSADSEYMTLPVRIAREDMLETKSSMLSGAEAAGSGALILVYCADTKLLDSYYFFSQSALNNQDSSPLMIDVPRTVCDFYILGNLNVIHKSSGAAENLAAAYGTSAFGSESDLESLVYRLDGADVNSTYRRETMAEVGTFGLPYQHIVKNVNVVTAAGIPGSDACRRLFSKVSVTIDHSAFDGGSAANVDYFVNKKLYMRQVNGMMKPFSTESVKASSSSDLVMGDYDDDMAPTNTGHGTYVFYVPENRQGTVSGIGYPKDKTMTNTAIPEAVRNYGTYVEFTGTLSGAVGGFGGDVTYKFFLGENNTTDFNVTRSKDYQVTLSFTSDGLFNPYWKVNANLSDVRLFHLTSDQAFENELPDAQMVAVRKNRSGAVYVWSAADASQPNLLVGKSVVDPSYSPSNYLNCAWTSDFLSATNVSADVPNREWLLDRGITPSWDSTHGKLTFTVTDPSKFNAHIGEEKTLTLTLLPGDGSNTVRLKVKLYENISITWDQSITEHFLPGMKRTATLTGFSGDVQYKCSDAHMYKNQAAPGATGLILDSYSSSQQVSSGTLPIWCYYVCLHNHVWNLTFRPVDSFNDGEEVICPISSAHARIQFSNMSPTTGYSLQIDGKEELVSWYIYEDGTSTAIPRSAFDDAAFSDIYPMVFGFASDMTTVTGDDTSYDPGASNSFIDLVYKGTTNSYGYPELYMFRKSIGTEYDVRADDNIRVKPSYVYFMPKCSNWDGYQGTFGSTEAMDVRLIPFITKNFDPGFGTEYHDYTLTPKWSHFDLPYRDYATNWMSSSNCYFNVSDRNNITLWVTATNADSECYGVQSESVFVSQVADGDPLKLEFVDNGTNHHSVGPHDIYATVTNKWSGETIDVKLNTNPIGIYIDLVCAGEFWFDSMLEASIRTVCVSDWNRTSLNLYDYVSELKTFVHGIHFFYREGSEYIMTSTSSDWDGNNPDFEEVLIASCTWDYTNPYCPSWTQLSNGDWDELIGTSSVFNVQFYDNASPPVNIKSIIYESLRDSTGGGYYIFHRLYDLYSNTHGWKNILDNPLF